MLDLLLKELTDAKEALAKAKAPYEARVKAIDTAIKQIRKSDEQADIINSRVNEENRIEKIFEI